MFAPVTASVTLHSPAKIAAVWAIYEQSSRWPEVLTDLVSARIEPDGKLVPGAVIVGTAKPDTQAIDMRYDVIEAQREQRLVLASNAKGLHARTLYIFAEEDGGTRLTVSSELRAERLLVRIVLAAWRAHYTAQFNAALRMRTQALLSLAEHS